MRMWLVLCLFVSPVAILTSADTPTKSNTPHWEMHGDLTEACTCAVPCTCNFGQGPSPHHYCYAIFSLDIHKGHYGDVTLNGLHLAGVHGKKSKVWYIDAKATPEQAAALRAIAQHMLKSEHVGTAEIVQEIGEKGNKLEIVNRGGFETDYIMGMDKKTPVVVENNTSWNIARSTKGKTKVYRYKDEFGNKVDMKGTNGNQGNFDWTDQTERYF